MKSIETKSKLLCINRMLSSKISVPVPKIVDREFRSPLLCGPGPCNLFPSVIEALSKPVISPRCDEYYNVVEDIRTGIKYIFQTQSDLVMAISGSGHAGMETVISNLVGPEETMLIASRGMWDERASNMAKRYGIKAVEIRIPFNTTFNSEQIEVELRKLKPTALFITHGDSSTGTVQNLEGLGKLCHKYGALLIVDTVVSIGGVPFFMDDWGVDAVYASSQKVLSGPAGISPVAFSKMAEKKINSRKHQPPFYFDIKLLAQQWNCHGNTRVYHHTMSPPLLWALKKCLQEICTRTLPLFWEQHARITTHFCNRLEQNGFQLLVPKAEERLATVTTVILPKGYDYSEFCKYIQDNHNILIFGGLGPTAGKALRIGIMGVNSTQEVADAIVDAMIDASKALKKCSL